MPQVKVTTLANIESLSNEDLRAEAEGWADGDKIVCGKAIMVPDDGSGPMEGFLRVNAGQGMVMWGEDFSDWVSAESLEELFKEYLK